MQCIGDSERNLAEMAGDQLRLAREASGTERSRRVATARIFWSTLRSSLARWSGNYEIYSKGEDGMSRLKDDPFWRDNTKKIDGSPFGVRGTGKGLDTH